jgi:hypothetical protein
VQHLPDGRGPGLARTIARTHHAGRDAGGSAGISEPAATDQGSAHGTRIRLRELTFSDTTSIPARLGD